MKKRLLITSIVMMLVVAVALSTATYAWFTSNATVSASSISLTAATSSAPALGISWTDGNYTTSITATAPNGETVKFSPVAPETLSTSGTITDSTVVFKTAVTHSVAGDFVFNEAGEVPTNGAYTWTNGSQTSFFIKNLSPSNTISTITMTATITDVDTTDDVDASKLLRVGVFKYNSSTTKYELLGVLAAVDYTYTAVAASTPLTNDAAGSYYKMVNGKYVAAVAGTAAAVTAGTADYYIGEGNEHTGATTATEGKFFTRNAGTSHAKAVYGPIAQGASVNSMASIDCVESIVVASNLTAETAFELKVLVWEDGAQLGDVEQGKIGSIAFEFNA